jgi:ribosomal protein L28
MAIKITSKKPNIANNKPNSQKRTKKKQCANLQKITVNGISIITSAREARTFKKAFKAEK